MLRQHLDRRHFALKELSEIAQNQLKRLRQAENLPVTSLALNSLFFVIDGGVK
jgi:hypothetical protein